jgi:hypothetical protein
MASIEGPMNITVQISDPLLRDARNMATREGVTFRSLVERSLQSVVMEAKAHAPFKLRRASFKGEGLCPELRGFSWNRIRDLGYERRNR